MSRQIFLSIYSLIVIQCCFSSGQYNISMAESLTASKYDNYLKSLFNKAKNLNSTETQQCMAKKDYTFELSDKT